MDNESVEVPTLVGCPFCPDGGTPWLPAPNHPVRCSTCGAEGPSSDDLDTAAEAWNTRARSQGGPQAAEIGRQRNPDAGEIRRQALEEAAATGFDAVGIAIESRDEYSLLQIQAMVAASIRALASSAPTPSHELELLREATQVVRRVDYPKSVQGENEEQAAEDMALAITKAVDAFYESHKASSAPKEEPQDEPHVVTDPHGYWQYTCKNRQTYVRDPCATRCLGCDALLWELNTRVGLVSSAPKEDEEHVDATPRPWAHNNEFIIGADGQTVAQTFSKREEDYANAQPNAELIVRAVNAYAASSAPVSEGRCEGCGDVVTIDIPPNGHTRAGHDCGGDERACAVRCPVQILCGPVTIDPAATPPSPEGEK